MSVIIVYYNYFLDENEVMIEEEIINTLEINKIFTQETVNNMEKMIDGEGTSFCL